MLIYPRLGKKRTKKRNISRSAIAIPKKQNKLHRGHSQRLSVSWNRHALIKIIIKLQTDGQTGSNRPDAHTSRHPYLIFRTFVGYSSFLIVICLATTMIVLFGDSARNQYDQIRANTIIFVAAAIRIARFVHACA